MIPPKANNINALCLAAMILLFIVLMSTLNAGAQTPMPPPTCIPVADDFDICLVPDATVAPTLTILPYHTPTATAVFNPVDYFQCGEVAARGCVLLPIVNKE